MNRVRDWVAHRRELLSCLIEQPISETDFTDDRLADGLRSARQLASWNTFESSLLRRTIPCDPPERVRLDATTASTHHDANNSTLFKVGRSKNGTYNTQFKIMLATLDPLGMPIGLDVAARKRVVAGNLSDDPLYLPVYFSVRDALSQSGLLYIGDCKMESLEKRATMSDNSDYYLTPLPQTGHNPELLAKQIERVINGEVDLIDIYHQKDIPEDPIQKPDPKKGLAQGPPFTRSQTATINEKEIEWDERVFAQRFAQTVMPIHKSSYLNVVYFEQRKNYLL